LILDNKYITKDGLINHAHKIRLKRKASYSQYATVVVPVLGLSSVSQTCLGSKGKGAALPSLAAALWAHHSKAPRVAYQAH